MGNDIDFFLDLVWDSNPQDFIDWVGKRTLKDKTLIMDKLGMKFKD